MALDFEKGDGLIPAVVQDHITGKVLMLGYMNEESLAETRKSGKATFYSRSKKRLWVKGETSGHFLMVKEILEDCDGDTLLVKALPMGPICHTGSDTCFNESNANPITFLNHLRDIIEDRRSNPTDESYTASLFRKGINKVAQKVGEEAVEVVIEAKDDNKELFLNESADLLFHLMVLLSYKGFSLDDVVKILKTRHQSS